jgi:hypothetical protein
MKSDAAGERLIDSILKLRGVTRDEFHGRKRTKKFCDVRMEIANELRAMGFTVRRITILMDRDHSTVVWFLYPNIREKRRLRSKENWHKYSVLQKYEPDVRAAVLKVARENDIEPNIIIAQWVTERARSMAA